MVDRVRSWMESHPLAVLLLIALVLRLINLDGRSFQYDDTFSFFLARRSLPEIVNGTAADTMPPLFYFLLHFWQLLGDSSWWMRLLSVLLNLATLAMFYLLVRRWLGAWPAIWAALFASVSPLQIYHAQDVRMYALLVFGQMGYLWFFSRLWLDRERTTRTPMDWAGLVVFGIIAMYSHNLAIFALVVPNLFLLFHRDWKGQASLIAAQALIGFGSLPWLLMIPGQIVKIQRAFWTPPPGAAEIIQALVMFHAALPLPVILLVTTLFFSVLVLAFASLALWRRARQEVGVGFLLLALLVPPVLLFIVSYLMRPVFVPRGFLISSLAYYGLIGTAVSVAWKQGPGKLIAGVFVVCALVTLPYHYWFESFPRSPYQEMVQYLTTQAQPTDCIIHETKLSYFPAHYYQPDLPQVFLADVPGSPNDTYAAASQQAMQIFPQPDLELAVDNADTVYFITFTQTFNEYQEMGLAEHPNLAWLNDHFTLAGKQVFNDLEVYRYTR